MFIQYCAHLNVPGFVNTEFGTWAQNKYLKEHQIYLNQYSNQISTEPLLFHQILVLLDDLSYNLF